jgi:hypothetical protein
MALPITFNLKLPARPAGRFHPQLTRRSFSCATRRTNFPTAAKECRMKHLVRLATLAIALTPAAALAQMQTYYHAGTWDAFSGRSDKGDAVCGVGSTIPSDGRRLSIRFGIGGTQTDFSASKPEWSIPPNTPVIVVVQLGLSMPWTMHATGHDHNIDWTLDPNSFQTFDAQFRSAPSMTLTFPNGNEAPWLLSLTGSTIVSDTFGRCVRDLTQQVQAAGAQGKAPLAPSAAPAPQASTQPFSPPAPASPESSSPSPSSPPPSSPPPTSPAPSPSAH